MAGLAALPPLGLLLQVEMSGDTGSAPLCDHEGDPELDPRHTQVAQIPPRVQFAEVPGDASGLR